MQAVPFQNGARGASLFELKERGRRRLTQQGPPSHSLTRVLVSPLSLLAKHQRGGGGGGEPVDAPAPAPPLPTRAPRVRVALVVDPAADDATCS
eukprot:2045668-Rhodomonas_salina.1